MVVLFVLSSLFVPVKSDVVLLKNRIYIVIVYWFMDCIVFSTFLAIILLYIDTVCVVLFASSSFVGFFGYILNELAIKLDLVFIIFLQWSNSVHWLLTCLVISVFIESIVLDLLYQLNGFLFSSVYVLMYILITYIWSTDWKFGNHFSVSWWFEYCVFLSADRLHYYTGEYIESFKFFYAFHLVMWFLLLKFILSGF